jgi:hypothetical protein
MVRRGDQKEVATMPRLGEPFDPADEDQRSKVEDWFEQSPTLPVCPVPLRDRQGVFAHSFRCGTCALHFVLFSWRLDRHAPGTVTCPDCGTTGDFVHRITVLSRSRRFRVDVNRYPEIYDVWPFKVSEAELGNESARSLYGEVGRATRVDELTGQFERWLETFSRLRSRRRFRREAWFALGAIHGTLEVLSALGYPEIMDAILEPDDAPERRDDVGLALEAIARWLGRSRADAEAPGSRM